MRTTVKALQRNMASMATRPKLEVVGPVISSVAVDMVHGFPSLKGTPQQLFHDESMLKDVTLRVTPRMLWHEDTNITARCGRSAPAPVRAPLAPSAPPRLCQMGTILSAVASPSDGDAMDPELVLQGLAAKAKLSSQGRNRSRRIVKHLKFALGHGWEGKRRWTPRNGVAMALQPSVMLSTQAASNNFSPTISDFAKHNILLRLNYNR